MNASHDNIVEQVIRGRKTFNYRQWLVNVYPLTSERPGGKAIAEASPFDKSKCPPGKTKVASARFDPVRTEATQIRMGLLRVLSTIDSIEDAAAA